MNAGDCESQYPTAPPVSAGVVREVVVQRRGMGDEQASPDQVALLRRMTPEQRWLAAHRLYWTMRQHKAAFLQSQHPAWSEQQVEDEVRRIFSHART